MTWTLYLVYFEVLQRKIISIGWKYTVCAKVTLNFFWASIRYVLSIVKFIVSEWMRQGCRLNYWIWPDLTYVRKVAIFSSIFSSSYLEDHSHMRVRQSLWLLSRRRGGRSVRLGLEYRALRFNLLINNCFFIVGPRPATTFSQDESDRWGWKGNRFLFMSSPRYLNIKLEASTLHQ